MPFYTHNALCGSEVNEIFFKFLILGFHDKGDIHDRAVFGICDSALEHAAAVNGTVELVGFCNVCFFNGADSAELLVVSESLQRGEYRKNRRGVEHRVLFYMGAVVCRVRPRAQ